MVAWDELMRCYFPWWPYLLIHKNMTQVIQQLGKRRRIKGFLQAWNFFSYDKFRLLLSRAVGATCFLIAFKLMRSLLSSVHRRSCYHNGINESSYGEELSQWPRTARDSRGPQTWNVISNSLDWDIVCRLVLHIRRPPVLPLNQLNHWRSRSACESMVVVDQGCFTS